MLWTFCVAGLCHSNVVIVNACAKALRTIYQSDQSGRAPVVFHVSVCVCVCVGADGLLDPEDTGSDPRAGGKLKK